MGDHGVPPVRRVTASGTGAGPASSVLRADAVAPAEGGQGRSLQAFHAVPAQDHPFLGMHVTGWLQLPPVSRRQTSAVPSPARSAPEDAVERVAAAEGITLQA